MIHRRVRVTIGALTLAVIVNASAGPVQGQCTDPAPTNPCAPGDKRAATGCQIEWLFDPVPKAIFNGVPIPDLYNGFPRNRIICYDGDPRCDKDGVAGNNSCTFEIGACINNNDPRLPGCAPSDLSTVWVLRPRQRSIYWPLDATDANNQGELESLFGNFFGVDVIRRAYRSSPVSYEYSGVPDATQDECHGPVQLTVPLRVNPNIPGAYKTERKRFSVMGMSTASALAGRRGSTRTKLKLICRPSTCGDGVVKVRHEQCDDGNLINGDGCNQGCQIE